MSEWGVCVGCPWYDTPVREHSITATSGCRRDMTLNLNLNGLRANQLTQGAQGRHTESNLWPPCTKARCSILIGETKIVRRGTKLDLYD